MDYGERHRGQAQKLRLEYLLCPRRGSIQNLLLVRALAVLHLRPPLQRRLDLPQSRHHEDQWTTGGQSTGEGSRLRHFQQ